MSKPLYAIQSLLTSVGVPYPPALRVRKISELTDNDYVVTAPSGAGTLADMVVRRLGDLDFSNTEYKTPEFYTSAAQLPAAQDGFSTVTATANTGYFTPYAPYCPDMTFSDDVAWSGGAITNPYNASKEGYAYNIFSIAYGDEGYGIPIHSELIFYFVNAEYLFNFGVGMVKPNPAGGWFDYEPFAYGFPAYYRYYKMKETGSEYEHDSFAYNGIRIKVPDDDTWYIRYISCNSDGLMWPMWDELGPIYANHNAGNPYDPSEEGRHHGWSDPYDQHDLSGGGEDYFTTDDLGQDIHIRDNGDGLVRFDYPCSQSFGIRCYAGTSPTSRWDFYDQWKPEGYPFGWGPLTNTLLVSTTGSSAVCNNLRIYDGEL
jgi:hypothetical protein